MSDYLFAYGTLRRNPRGEMHHLLSHRGVFVGTGGYQGQLFIVDDYPGVVASDNPSDIVHGEVYRLLDARSVLACLDEYEECSPRFAEPHEYVRRKQNISLYRGGTLETWIYLYNLSTEGLQRMVSGDFYEQNAVSVKAHS